MKTIEMWIRIAFSAMCLLTFFAILFALLFRQDLLINGKTFYVLAALLVASGIGLGLLARLLLRRPTKP